MNITSQARITEAAYPRVYTRRSPLVSGKTDDAFRYWKESLYFDLHNTMSNSQLGIHAAALGGTWQAFVFHLLGVRVSQTGFSFDERARTLIPEKWHDLKMTLKYRNRTYSLDLESGRITELDIRRKTGGGMNQKKNILVCILSDMKSNALDRYVINAASFANQINATIHFLSSVDTQEALDGALSRVPNIALSNNHNCLPSVTSEFSRPHRQRSRKALLM